MENEKVDTAIEHFTNIAAEQVESKNGNTYIMYVNTGPDHFLHAKVYADIASDGRDNAPVGSSAPPVVNQRASYRKSKGGVYVPTVTRSDKFVQNGKPRHRTSRTGSRRR